MNGKRNTKSVVCFLPSEMKRRFFVFVVLSNFFAAGSCLVVHGNGTDDLLVPPSDETGIGRCDLLGYNCSFWTYDAGWKAKIDNTWTRAFLESRRVGSAQIMSTPISTAPAVHRAICLSFDYSITGRFDASLSVYFRIVDRVGRSLSGDNFVWSSNSRALNRRKPWQMQTLQFSAFEDVHQAQILFRARSSRASVAISNLEVYNVACYRKGIGDTFEEFYPKQILTENDQRFLSGQIDRTQKDFLWPNGVIPYEIEIDFTLEQQNAILDTMRYIENNVSCIRFVERQNEVSFVLFTVHFDGTCGSYFGRRPSEQRQRLMLSNECFENGFLAKYFFHMLGMAHEHVRPDRDDYVQINLDNVNQRHQTLFTVLHSFFDHRVLELDYDKSSLLHFESTRYGKRLGLKTITDKQNPELPLGNKVGPTLMDYQKLSALYCSPTSGGETIPPDTEDDTPCGITTIITNETAGVVQSYRRRDGQYRKDEFCAWLIIAKPNKIIRLTFDSLHLEKSPGCLNDYVEIFDGPDEHSGSIVKLCGDRRPLRAYETTGASVFISFITDSRIEGRGFVINFVEDEPVLQPEPDLERVTCNFDNETCDWENMLGQPNVWRRRTHPTSNSLGGKYLFVDARAVDRNRPISMLSGVITPFQNTDIICIRFWYQIARLRHKDVGVLNLIATANNDKLVVWQSHNSPSVAEWKLVETTLASNHMLPNAVYKLKLEAIVTTRQRRPRGGIAVDNVQVTAGECDSSGTVTTNRPPSGRRKVPVLSSRGECATAHNDCDFENNYCNWLNVFTDNSRNQLTWDRKEIDRSTIREDSNANNYFLELIGNSSDVSANLEMCSSQRPRRYRCFQFSYKMDGIHANSLTLKIQKADGDDSDLSFNLFHATGNKGPQWNQVKVNLETWSSDFSLTFVASTTSDQTTKNFRIALDNFKFLIRSCWRRRYARPVRVQRPKPTTVSNNLLGGFEICDFEPERDTNMCNHSLRLTLLDTPHRWQVDNSSSSRGPQVDSTSLTRYRGHYLAVYSGSGANGNQAGVRTYYVDASKVNCLRLSYHISRQEGRYGNSLDVVQEINGVDIRLFHATANSVASWQNVAVKISKHAEMSSYRIKFLATINDTNNSHVALDDIALISSPSCTTDFTVQGFLINYARRHETTNSDESYTCMFDIDSCMWMGRGDWQHFKAPRNNDANTNESFFFVTDGDLTPSARIGGEIASLTGPEVKVNLRSHVCLSFSYKIDGWFSQGPPSSMVVSVESVKSPQQSRVIAALSGTFSLRTQNWTRTRVSVFEKHNFKFAISIKSGAVFSAVIGIDSIIMERDCIGY